MNTLIRIAKCLLIIMLIGFIESVAPSVASLMVGIVFALGVWKLAE